MVRPGIQREVLLPPTRQYPGLVAFAVTAVAVVVGTLVKGIGFAIFAALFAAPFALMLWYILSMVLGYRAYVTYGRRARETMTAFIGQKPNYLDAVGVAARNPRGAATGSGLAITDEFIYILDDGEVGRIPYGMVRGWEWKIAGYNRYDSDNLADGTKMLLKNHASRANAQLESGFFISVKDVDKPVWQFRTMDRQVLLRWNEIFKQAFERPASRIESKV